MKNSKLLTQFFALAALEGFLCLITLLSFSPDPQTAWFLGFSRNRFIMVSVGFVGVLIFISLIFKAKRNPSWADSIIDSVDVLFKQERIRTILLGIFILVFLGGIFFIFGTYARVDYKIPPKMLATFELIRIYMSRLTPYVLWGVLLSIQSLVFLSILGYGSRNDFYRAVRLISILIFPFLFIVLWLLKCINPDYYYHINKEDQLVEWLTFACLIIAGLLSLLKAFQAKQAGSRYIWFFLLFGIACVVLGFEEISWGQRIFQIESTEFFLENSDQQEINVHNVVNRWFNVRTKHVAAFALFVFGVGLPMLALNSKIESLFEKMRIVVPPLFLSFGFALGAFLTLDIFSGQEEEIAELFLSLALLLFIILENLKPIESSKIEKYG